MVASLALLMASMAVGPAMPPATEKAASFRPTSRATASATASIRIISGVRFGANYTEGDSVALRRKAQLTDAAGQPRDAELLEFQ